jgi:hypothetical protein
MILHVLTDQGLNRFPVATEPGNNGETVFFNDSGSDFAPVEKYLPDNAALSSDRKICF